jgi:hypothetical protein
MILIIIFILLLIKLVFDDYLHVGLMVPTHPNHDILI